MTYCFFFCFERSCHFKYLTANYISFVLAVYTCLLLILYYIGAILLLIYYSFL